MPRKIRELKRDLQRAGFIMRPSKGSHTRWKHPLVPGYRITLSGHDGDDAQDYQEQQVREGLERLRKARER
jgi:predicted RNA binding protein YcfA (HicA-like mRNA interferase family)